MRHHIRGITYEFDRDDVLIATQGRWPGRGRNHFVVIEGREWPVKEAFRLVVGGRPSFHTNHAKRAFDRLGFELRRRG